MSEVIGKMIKVINCWSCNSVINFNRKDVYNKRLAGYIK